MGIGIKKLSSLLKLSRGNLTLLNLNNDTNKCTECSFIAGNFFSTLERNREGKS